MLNDGRKLESQAWLLTKDNGTELNELNNEITKEQHLGQVKNKNYVLPNTGIVVLYKLAHQLVYWAVFNSGTICLVSELKNKKLFRNTSQVIVSEQKCPCVHAITLHHAQNLNT